MLPAMQNSHQFHLGKQNINYKKKTPKISNSQTKPKTTFSSIYNPKASILVQRKTYNDSQNSKNWKMAWQNAWQLQLPVKKN